METYISTLTPPPENCDISPKEQGTPQETRERERRERALAERQRQVQEEKRRQRGALQFSKGVLRVGEAEIERAMRVGKDGLKGYMVDT